MRIPRPLTDTQDMDEKDDGMEARFAKLEEFMKQHHKKEPTNSLEADDIQGAVVKHSEKESKGRLEDSKAGSEHYKEIGIFSRFEKVLKEQQQKGLQDSDLLLELDRLLKRMERGTVMPLKFTDAVGRKFTFPFQVACTWKVSYPIFQLGNLIKLTTRA